LGTVALDLATDELGDLEGGSIVVVGAGKVGSLVCSALGRAHASKITVVNRSADRARKIAVEIGADTAPLDQLPTLLEKASVVITATTSDEPTIDEATVRQSLAERANTVGPLLIIDGAVNQEDVDRLTRSIVNKLFHTPMLRLRGAEELNGRHTQLLGAVSELFDLGDPGEPTPPE
jgi:glutamyl-tRNA reductase